VALKVLPSCAVAKSVSDIACSVLHAADALCSSVEAVCVAFETHLP